eukprot:scaffold46813_cov38-Tisochrysis_lutea.AAC.20
MCLTTFIPRVPKTTLNENCSTRDISSPVAGLTTGHRAMQGLMLVQGLSRVSQQGAQGQLGKLTVAPAHAQHDILSKENAVPVPGTHASLVTSITRVWIPVCMHSSVLYGRQLHGGQLPLPKPCSGVSNMANNGVRKSGPGGRSSVEGGERGEPEESESNRKHRAALMSSLRNLPRVCVLELSTHMHSHEGLAPGICKERLSQLYTGMETNKAMANMTKILRPEKVLGINPFYVEHRLTTFLPGVTNGGDVLLSSLHAVDA